MFHQLAHVLMARHLISPMWLEEMHTNNDDDGVASTDFLLLLGKERTGKKVVTAGASRQRRQAKKEQPPGAAERQHLVTGPVKALQWQSSSLNMMLAHYAALQASLARKRCRAGGLDGEGAAASMAASPGPCPASSALWPSNVVAPTPGVAPLASGAAAMVACLQVPRKGTMKSLTLSTPTGATLTSLRMQVR